MTKSPSTSAPPESTASMRSPSPSKASPRSKPSARTTVALNTRGRSARCRRAVAVCGDLGVAEDSTEELESASRLNDTPCVLLNIRKQSGTNTVEVVGRVRALLPTFQKQLPESVKLGILRDQSVAVHEAFSDVKTTLVLAVGLVVLVIFLFLPISRTVSSS